MSTRETTWNAKKVLIKKNGEKYFSMYFLNLIWQSRKKTNKKILSMLRKVSVHDLKTSAGETLLHAAVEDGNLWLTKFLLKKGSNIDAQDNKGITPLMLAFYPNYYSYKVLKCLLKGNPNIYLLNCKGQSALGIAMNLYGGSERCLTIRKFFLNIIKESHVDNNFILSFLRNMICPLYRVIYLNRPQVTKAMIKGCDINREGRRGDTALHVAANLMDLRNIKVLLQNGADKTIMNNCGKLPFACVSLENFEKGLEMMKLLLPDENILGSMDEKALSVKTQLNYFFRKETAKTLESFLEHCKMDLQARDNNERTPLHYLALNNKQGVINLFRDAEFDFDALDMQGICAMHLAAYRCDLEMMKFLLSRGANVNATIQAIQNESNVHLNSVYYVVAFSKYAMFKKLSCLEFLMTSGAIFMSTPERQNGPFHEYRRQETICHFRLVVEYIVLLELLGTSISHEVLNKIMNIAELKNSYDMCRRKFEELKSSIICGTTSLYDLLIEEKSADAVARHARNRKHLAKLMKSFREIEFKSETNRHLHPRLNENLNLQWCQKALENRFFMVSMVMCWRKKVAYILSDSSGLFEPDHIVVETIVNYLSEPDLKKIFC